VTSPYGGNVPPRPDQYVPVLPSGTQPGTSTGVVRATKVIVSGPGEGVFVYNGVPAFGNPPIDYMSNSATDPFGNSLPQAGTVSYVSPSIWNALTGGQLIFADGTFLSSIGGNSVWETVSATAAIQLADASGNVSLNAAGRVLANGNNVTGLFGNLAPSGLPLSGSATLTAVINAVNSMFSRFQNMGVFP
jgi:hypothetical protein